MKLHSIETGLFKLDGGAMFGVVPKSLWSKKIQPDEKNLCTWSMRCLLIEDSERLILVDTGLGDKQSEKFFSFVQPHGDDSLLSSLTAKGFEPDDITDVLLTHLHFDHCGGAVSKDSNGKLSPTFKNATYWSHSKHWDWATNPNPREKASFLTENFEPLLITIEEQSFIYCADLIPSIHHLPLSWVIGYDVRPLITMNEKVALYDEVIKNETVLIFEHDADHEACTLKWDERGRVAVNEVMKINEF